MARPKAQVPSLRFHVSGQSVVTINGRDIYLGKHDTPQSLARYAVLIGIYQANQLSLPDGFDVLSLDAQAQILATPLAAIEQHQEGAPILIKHLTAAYRELVKVKYAIQKSERERCIKVCNDIDEHDGNRLAAKYGPVALSKQRDRWVESGKSRVYCNRLVNIVWRMFKYAVSQELVDESSWRKLKSLDGLREGQTDAPETEPVRPVSLSDVRATAKQLSPVVRAMIRVHVGTGMRPSELCMLRPCDIDRSKSEWMYRPPRHKNKSKGKIRAIPIVNDAREAITDYLNRPSQAYCFSPAEAVAQLNAIKRAKRKTKVQPSQINRAKENPKMPPKEHYNPNSYRRAIQRAAKRAKVPSWFPYQLRHLTLTEVRNALDCEAAQALGGHSRMDMTQHYAKLQEEKAIEAAKAAPSL